MKKKHSIIRNLLSVLASFVGIQKQSNHQQDLEKGSLKTMILLAVFSVIVLIWLLVKLSQLALNT